MRPATKPRVRPTGDHLVVVPWDGEDMGEEGIYLRDVGAKLCVGTVQMVGPDVRTLKNVPRIQQGQRVLYNRCAGARLSLDGGGLYVVLLREGDVCGILEEVTDLQRCREGSLELILAN